MNMLVSLVFCFILIIFSPTIAVELFVNERIDGMSLMSGDLAPPVIDIGPLMHPEKHSDHEIRNIQTQMVEAAEKWGFYYVINHNISRNTIDSVLTELRRFFALPKEVKSTIRRNRYNSRGYADDEYTKQLIDLKEIYDFGPPTLYDDLSPKALENQKLDGVNYWLPEEILPHFRSIIENYYEDCYKLSNLLVTALIDALDGCFSDFIGNNDKFFKTHFSHHTSMLRLNYYPIANNTLVGEDRLGISRHTDAGALTILLQDPAVSSLEVYSGSKQDANDGAWVPVDPIPYALTVNLGDMLQVWTNNRLKAAEHRVKATKQNSLHPRSSIAFFLNPNYDSEVTPYPCLDGVDTFYNPIRWGDFRSLRFLGDYEDVGEEVQIEKYRRNRSNR
jgi:isopenicillin N synthase-like dioxygenase